MSLSFSRHSLLFAVAISWFCASTLCSCESDTLLEYDVEYLLQFDLESMFGSLEVTDRRVRREVRTLSKTDWSKVTNAMNVMKFTPQSEGIKLYGNKFWNWDNMVCFHAQAAYSWRGNMNHGGPQFSPWHRAFSLMFENSIRAVDPSIEAVPYWDFRIDDSDPLNTTIWSEAYFGNIMGDAEKDFGIENGPFAYWPIGNAAASGCEDLSNIWGQMRDPVMLEKSEYVTRMGGVLCNYTNTDMGDTSYWDKCLNASDIDTFWKFDQCFEGRVHGPAHPFVGGTRMLDGSIHVAGSTDDSSGAIGCFDWTGFYWLNVTNHTSSKMMFRPEYGCFDCPTGCSLEDDSERCQGCLTSSEDGLCTTNIYGEVVEMQYTTRENTQIWGDFTDGMTSPNDPMFYFHHVNMDRYAYLWQMNNFANAPYYNYPTQGWETGLNLDDVAAPETPFMNVFDHEMFSIDKALTYRDILDATTFKNVEYLYDDMYEALKFLSSLSDNQRGNVDKVVDNVHVLWRETSSGAVGGVESAEVYSGVFGLSGKFDGVVAFVCFCLLCLAAYGMACVRLGSMEREKKLKKQYASSDMLLL